MIINLMNLLETNERFQVESDYKSNIFLVLLTLPEEEVSSFLS